MGGSAGGGRNDAVRAKAATLGMQLPEDEKYFHLASEAVEADVPLGWEARTDAMGEVYYLNEANGTRRERLLSQIRHSPPFPFLAGEKGSPPR